MSGMDQATEDQWHVQIEQGDVRLWTLDQLDAAFKAELVDESTFVLEVGKTEWMQLGTLLGGGGDDEPESEAAPLPAVSTYAPAPVAAAAPVMFTETPSIGPYSTAPMAADIEDLDSPAAFRSSRKGPKVIGFGVALLAAGAAAFMFTRPAPAPEVTAVAPVAAAVAPPPAPAPVVDAKPADDTSNSLSARLTADQRQKLADADKVHEAKMAAQQKLRAAAAPHHGKSKSGKEKNPFHNGGDKYDPLNAKL